MTHEKKEAAMAQASAFLRNVAAALAAVAAVLAFCWWALGPRIIEEARTFLADEIGLDVTVIASLQEALTSQQTTIANISATQVQLASTVKALSEQVAAMDEQRKASKEPPVRFATRGNRIEDGRIGSTIAQTWAFLKEGRDCGRPRSRAYFINGGGRTHIFVDKSTSDAAGFGVPAPVQQGIQTLTLTVRIPDDDGVQPGRGYAYLVIDYPELCPEVPPIRSPEVPFTILPRN